MSRELRPRKPKIEVEVDDSEEALRERKAERNVAYYARNKKKLLSKQKIRRQQNREAYNQQQREYHRENKEDIKKRRIEKEQEISRQKRRDHQRKVQSMKKKHPYDEWSDVYFSACNGTYFPKNKFFCSKMRKHYQLHQNRQMEVFDFFDKIALHDECEKRFHRGFGEDGFNADTEERKRIKIKEYGDERKGIKYEQYEWYSNHWESMTKMGGRVETMFKKFLPKDPNRFYCGLVENYYVYKGTEEMDAIKFFKEIADHRCKDKFHIDKDDGNVTIYDPEEESAASEEAKCNE